MELHFQVTGSVQQISDKCTRVSPGAWQPLYVQSPGTGWSLLQQPPHLISGTHTNTKTASFWSQALYSQEPPCVVLLSVAGTLLCPAPITSEPADLIQPNLMERERSHRPKNPAIFMNKQQLDRRETFKLISYWRKCNYTCCSLPILGCSSQVTSWHLDMTGQSVPAQLQASPCTCYPFPAKQEAAVTAKDFAEKVWRASGALKILE